MEYRLVITEHAEELLDNLIYYLLYKLKNEQAAKHLLNGVENVYERMETNPQQFAISRDSYLASKNYREALIPQMDYVIIFGIEENIVNILVWNHDSTNIHSMYRRKYCEYIGDISPVRGLWE